MPDSLPSLEARRTDLFRQLAALGDFRRGSVTTTSGKCGKATCHCAKPDDPGHGPNFRLTRKIRGKTLTENLPLCGGVAQSSAGSGDVSSFSGTVRTDCRRRREDL